MARGPEVRIATLATDGVERRGPGAPRSVAAHRESAEPMVDVAATVSRSCDPWHAAARAAASDVGTTGPQLRMPSCRRLVVVVAHPHEELCAAGGLMRELVNRGVRVSILAVTDTGAEYLAAAYRTLGLTGVRRYRLGVPGGCVEAASTT